MWRKCTTPYFQFTMALTRCHTPCFPSGWITFSIRVSVETWRSCWVIKNSYLTRGIIRASLIWCDSLRQLVLLLSVTAVTACTSQIFPFLTQKSKLSTLEINSFSLLFCFPDYFRFPSLSLFPGVFQPLRSAGRPASCCLASGRCFVLFFFPSGALSALEVTLATLRVLVVVSVPTVGTLRGPYAAFESVYQDCLRKFGRW